MSRKWLHWVVFVCCAVSTSGLAAYAHYHDDHLHTSASQCLLCHEISSLAKTTVTDSIGSLIPLASLIEIFPDLSETEFLQNRYDFYANPRAPPLS